MGWKKVLLTGQVTAITDLWAATPPAAGTTQAIVVDDQGALSLGDTGAALRLKDNGNALASNSETIDFQNYFTIGGTTDATVNLNLGVGELDSQVLLLGGASTGLHDWSTTTTVNQALVDLDNIVDLLAPAPPIPLDGSFGFIYSVQGNSSPENLRNQDGSNTNNTVFSYDVDNDLDIDFHVQAGTGNLGTNASEGAFGPAIYGTSFYKIELVDVSAGAAYIDWHEVTAPAVDTDYNNVAVSEGIANDTVTIDFRDFYDYSASTQPEGFWNCAVDVGGHIHTSGASGPEVGYEGNRIKLTQYDDSGMGSVIGSIQSTEFAIFQDKWLGTAFQSGGYGFYTESDGANMSTRIATWRHSFDSSGNCLLSNSYYKASGITRLRAGDKLPFTFNTLHYLYIEDNSGDYWVNESSPASGNTKGKCGTISNTGRGVAHDFYWLDYYFVGGGAGYTWAADVNNFYIGGNIDDLGTGASENGVWWEVSESDTNQTHGNFKGCDLFSEHQDLYLNVTTMNDTTIPSFNGMNMTSIGIDTGKKVATIAKPDPMGEVNRRCKTFVGQYPTIGSPVTYDSDANITQGDYADSLVYNGREFYHPWDTAGTQDYTSNNLLANWTNFVGYDYSGISSEGSSSYRYMMQDQTVNSSATSKLKITLKSQEWSKDGEGNNANVRIYAKLVDGSGSALTNWFDCQSNMGASAPSPSDPNGTACHDASHADNDYSGDTLVKICDMGMFLNDNNASIVAYVRVGIKHSVSQNDYKFNEVTIEAND